MLECDAVKFDRDVLTSAKSASSILCVHAAVLQMEQQVPLPKGVTPQNTIIFCNVTPCSLGQSTNGSQRRTAFIFSGSSWSFRNTCECLLLYSDISIVVSINDEGHRQENFKCQMNFF